MEHLQPGKKEKKDDDDEDCEHDATSPKYVGWYATSYAGVEVVYSGFEKVRGHLSKLEAVSTKLGPFLFTNKRGDLRLWIALRDMFVRILRVSTIVGRGVGLWRALLLRGETCGKGWNGMELGARWGTDWEKGVPSRPTHSISALRYRKLG